MADLSRRTILTAAASLPLARLAGAAPAPADDAPIQTGAPFTLPPLPYAYDALEKAIDAATMALHHDKHHATYVKNLNDALAKAPPEWGVKTLEEILAHLGELPASIRTTVRNNGGGHHNHTLFWESMSPNGGGAPTGRTAEVVGQFGGFEAFKAKFEDAGLKRFGSGWAWLVFSHGTYAIESTANQDSPLMVGAVPILGNDVWEHAYYLRYQNRRADYLKAWWNVVNWAKVNERIAKAER